MILAHGPANFASKKVMKQTVSTTSLLSTLWIFVLLNIIFRDLHQLLNPIALQEMLTQKIPESQVLLFGIILEIPISMLLLCRILPTRVNKWANLIAAIITALGFLSTLPTADMDDMFFTLVKLIALIAIVYLAWGLNSSTQPSIETK